VLLRRGADGVLAAHGPSGQAVSVSLLRRGPLLRQVRWKLATNLGSCKLFFIVLSRLPVLALCPHAQVPAVPGTVVRDVVGCGNACCGAFLVRGVLSSWRV
jgi:hypothetical protein